jgi:ribosomal protein S24E
MLLGLKMGFVQEHENKLMKRRAVTLLLESSGNPGAAAAVKAVADEAGVGEDQVLVQRIRSEFGKKEFVVEALVYDSVADLEKAGEGRKLGKKLVEKMKKAEESEKGDAASEEQPAAAPEGDGNTKEQPGSDSQDGGDGAAEENKEEKKEDSKEGEAKE